jgi:protein-L-isoaspartate(D-aspartate) O-methyltransferase
MSYIDFMSPLHKSTTRDYLARVNDPEFPKAKAAELAKKWGFDYWDGDRRINYGGYRYMEGRWEKVAKLMADHYDLKAGDKILDIGCGKGFLLFDFTKVVPGIEVYGVDISEYAVENSKLEIKSQLQVGNCTQLPFDDKSFDFVYSINTFHNLHNEDLEKALNEINRVSKSNKQYICVESYRNEIEKTNLLYWQVTCEQFNTPKEWDWWFRMLNYYGDHSFIYFE